MEPFELPWRNERTYYKWDGESYILWHREFAQPEYRFQSIQDGDLALNQQEYDKAIGFYQQAIFNNELKGYSPAIQENLRANHLLDPFSNQPTPEPVAPDPTEYSKLAAYAYYRMVILQIKLGEMDAAQIQYATLQEKFPTGQAGYPYAEMASAFWETYQSSQNMTNACGTAIQYAAEHPGILTVLGSDYHGWQSHKYVPADVCPFR
jgi:tetratricopeptide (TPR) repeat protein